MLYDLHSHTTASDGKLSPTELVDYAIEKKLSGIAITDHNTASGVKVAINYSKGKNIEVIPGIEISCDCENKVKEVHIVGLFIDYKNPKFKKLKELNKVNSKIAMEETIQKIKPLGYDVKLSDLEKRGGFGKNTLAYLLLEKYPNDFLNRKNVFDRLIGWGQPGMVYGRGVELKYAIDTIHESGGIAIFAHPGQLRQHDDYFLTKFVELGGDGVEVGRDYSYLDNSDELDIKYKKFAKDNNLLLSCGSDFHFPKPGKNFGEIGLNDEEFSKMKKRLQ